MRAERRREGARNYRPNGFPETTMTPEAPDVLLEVLNYLERLGKKELVSNSGITLPGGKGSTRYLRTRYP